LEFLKELNGKKFSDLPRNLQRRIEETQVTVNVVEPGTPEDAKLNIFKRINTGGMALSAQEIRHAINPGPAREFLKMAFRLTSTRYGRGRALGGIANTAR